jgi:hypothetical protein
MRSRQPWTFTVHDNGLVLDSLTCATLLVLHWNHGTWLRLGDIASEVTGILGEVDDWTLQLEKILEALERRRIVIGPRTAIFWKRDGDLNPCYRVSFPAGCNWLRAQETTILFGITACSRR